MTQKADPQLHLQMPLSDIPVELARRHIITDSICHQMIDDIYHDQGFQALDYLMSSHNAVIYTNLTGDLLPNTQIHISIDEVTKKKPLERIKPQYKSIW